MGAQDALEVIDAKAAVCAADPFAIVSGTTVALLLAEVREALTADPDWSEVTEGNLRSELRYERDNAAAGAVMYEAALRHVEGERDRARSLAVLLEQENECLRTGAGRRVL
jgi:hypothetical protein